MGIAKLGRKLGEIKIENETIYRVVAELRIYNMVTTGRITYKNNTYEVVKEKDKDYFRIITIKDKCNENFWR